MIKSASVKELEQWLKADEAVLIDVRENGEYAQGYIPGAVLLPLAELTSSKLPDHSGKKLVMQCRSGGRSRSACGILTKEQSDLEVYNLEGGIIAWQQAGFAVSL